MAERIPKPPEDVVTIGILALQGAFAEHQVILKKLPMGGHKIKIELVRVPDDLQRCDALIIPGGESTTIALLARLAGLLEPLRDFIRRQRPVWGTCAGAILLSERAEGTKKGGQELLGGVNISIARNGWGSQIESFEAPLLSDDLKEADRPFTGVFIRAPVILSVSPTPEHPIQIISRLPADHLPRTGDPALEEEDDTDPRDPRTIVALRQGRHMVTTFHPELTNDNRFHEYFLRECVLPSLRQ
ncbi:SNO glutamine amidotransferase [Punctularia strigosozonata HHB-11173 SS5]|uniref:glutaminase n=1 Tax=Punctularia strigosozonata (strain HHB-11173) TaxID=741275 RepID=R7S1P4_PUNST|nr:SNO glutamine amidotransferase [Punctularia strigosozonata HHB-11173 SS5]EIN04305.1 SNO glutamine amidotransferase [Punctularia strigosozonata HHB-11173 SS5]